MAEQKITADTLIYDAVNMGNPEEIAAILQGAGLHCFGCAYAHHETIGDIALVHGTNINELLEKLNAAIEG